ncbi:MAG: GntR family transcriptional regulator [Acidobacteria bacterium]|nr:GntR family transcriptional regulator [Acidobacteriota bacterium]
MGNGSKTRLEPFAFRLDTRSGVPVYRQMIDQILAAIAARQLGPGDKLPTVRQVAVDLAINPNTVVRAYKELEIRDVLTTQQGSGTFISDAPVKADEVERRRRLNQFAGDVAARAGADGFSLREVIEVLESMKK